MPAPQNVSLPPGFTLANGYTVRVTAIDPTSGNVVAGVIASNVSLSVNQYDTTPVTPETPGQIFLLPGPAVAV